jgi:hypothetical protein
VLVDQCLSHDANQFGDVHHPVVESGHLVHIRSHLVYRVHMRSSLLLNPNFAI